MSQGTFLDTLICFEAFKRIFVFRPNIHVFLSGQSIWVKNGLILKSAFFNCL